MAVVNNGFLVSYEFAVLITHFGKMHLFHGKVLIGFIRPFTIPDVNVTNNFYPQRPMRNHRHICIKRIITVLACNLLVNALFVVQMQVGKFLSCFIKSHEILYIIHYGNAWQ